ncbi:cysteine desulfurase family protein [Gemmata sp.]|uniref:cysteine desulfurase family protein n=1 Tax=Gemmata sp. TaxID=1914242 RepID=UPI003F714F8D
MRPIYLDHNATTPLLPEARDAMLRAEAEAFGNPASPHAAGRAARRVLEDARERVASLLGASPDEVTFTSGATEANNLAVFSLGRDQRGRHGEGETRSESRSPVLSPPLPLSVSPPLVAASHLEHPCVIEPLRRLEARGIAVAWWPVSGRGTVAPQPLPPETRLVCVMLANHETGALQPVREIAATLPPGVALHCDAVQAIGKLPVNFRDLGATTLTASAHKFGGPKGVGVLIAKRGVKLAPRTFGGHQQGGRRPGTESPALAAGLAAALEHSTRNLTANRANLAAFRERLWDRLRAAAPVELNGPGIGAPDALPTTLNVSFTGCRADLLLMALDLAGVACSTGSACSSGSLLPSPVLGAMGVSADRLRSALRFSLSPTLELADIDEAADRITAAVQRHRESSKMG